MAEEYCAFAIVAFLEEEERMATHRVHRRRLRDATDPFDIPEDRFIEIYRLDREMARYLIDTLKPHIPCGHTRRAIKIEIKILIALHFYAQGAYQKSAGQDHNIALSQSSTSQCIKEVSVAITTFLSHRWIKFPQSRSDISSVQRSFYEKFGFPGVIGCVDGTHVLIKGPSDENLRISYYDRKCNYSINVQVICGANAEILSISAKFPGSVHDAAIWMTSDIRATLRQANSPGVWLLGDSGYPVEPWLLTPVEGQTSEPIEKYNKQHKHTRNVVERTFGILKMRFRCLLKQRILVYDHYAAGNIIYACAILHNMCITRNLALPSDYSEELSDDEDGRRECQERELIDVTAVQHSAAGRTVRENVIRRYFTN